jgi:AraC-like DNA-binding protein
VHRIPHPPGSKFFVLSFAQRFLRPELDVDPLDIEEVALSRAPELAPFVYQEFVDFRVDGADLDRAQDACRAMAAESERRGFCSAELIRANLLILLGTVCRRYEAELTELARTRAQNVSRRESLARVSRYIRENLTHRITLSDAAAAASLSPNYLAHLIKKDTGKTLTDLVTERRLERARELLAHTTMRVAEVARAVGFDDEAYFARRFRQWYDLSPRDFRERAPARR